MKKLFALLICICLLFSLTACGDDNNGDNGDNGGASASGFQVIFFDIENSSDGSVHYDGVNNDKTLGYTGVKPADCYMIKAGNTEILVDAGFQLQTPVTDAYNQRVAKIYQENVLKKIEQYCTDGVLEYLFVTHGDYDHLIGFAVEGGILDYFYNNNKQIGKIIDFDSDLVTYLSAANGNDIYPSGYNNFFSGSTIIDLYRAKRDKLVEEKGTKHIPAASFFKGTDFLNDNTLINAMPNEYLEKYFRLDQSGKLTEQINTSLLTNFYYFSDDVILHNQCNEITKQPEASNLTFKSNYKNLDLSFGTLKNENDRYYFSITLENNMELRILYNWFYDHFYKHSFNSADRNNISVCFEIVSGQKEFLSFGDLGSGETGLINYYSNTNILSNIDCFKASHHGSTSNGENSQKLFELIKADVVIVPGVAQINRDILSANNMTTDPIFSGLSSTAVMKKDFFSNVTKGKADAKIYCTQVAQLLDTQSGFSLISAPLYGDITVNFTNDAVKVDCSYKGEIDSYISGFSDEMKHFKFSNTKDGVMLSYNETDHWKAIYQDNGKSQGE